MSQHPFLRRHIYPISIGFTLALCACDNPNAIPSPPPLPPAPAHPNPASTSAPDDELGTFIRSRYTKFEYRIPMRDGIHLYTQVYIPNDASPSRRYPFLLLRTPYSISPYGADRYTNQRIRQDFAREGFMFTFQDVRGRGASEGEYVHVRPHNPNKQPTDTDESTDTYDTLEWLINNIPHHNGKAGMWGISYPGFYTAAGSIDSHPALAAVSPQAPIADWFIGDDAHHHGAFSLLLSFGFFYGTDVPRPKPTQPEDWKPFSFPTPDGYRFYLGLGPLNEVETTHYKAERAFWKDLVQHPNYDSFWKARTLLPHLKSIKAAVLTVGGWFDMEDLYGTLATYRSIEQQNPKIQNTLIMGPWLHGGWSGNGGNSLADEEFGFATANIYHEKELAFFKHHLKDGPDPQLPEAWVFETGANRFRSFDTWPPAGLTKTRFHIRENGLLSTESPPNTESQREEFISDPNKPVPYSQNLSPSRVKDWLAEDQRFAAMRPDVIVYESEPLENDMTIAGPLSAELWVSTTGTDADWIVKLCDEYPPSVPGFSKEDEKAGKKNRGMQQSLIRGEIFRGRFRDSYETPKPFIPGEITRLQFAMPDVFHTFRRGHRLVLHIQSTWFPFFDRNPQKFVPNIFEAKPADFIKATHTLYRAKDMPSGIDVFVLPGQP